MQLTWLDSKERFGTHSQSPHKGLRDGITTWAQWTTLTFFWMGEGQINTLKKKIESPQLSDWRPQLTLVVAGLACFYASASKVAAIDIH